MKHLEIGQRIHCILYGGKDGTIFAIHSEQSPEKTRSLMGGVGVTGGSAHFDIVWDDGTKSLHTPESLVRQSVQWRVLDKPVSTPDEIKARLEYLEQCTTQAAQEQEAANKAFMAAQEELIKQYPKLKREGEGADGSKLAAINLRTLLKEAFPGVKFSVRSDYSSVGVRWEDGPTEKRAAQIVNKFKSGHFNGMEDIYESKATPWNCLFGAAEYSSVSRSMSDEVFEHCIDALYEYFGPDMAHVERKPAQEMRNDQFTSFPGVDLTVADAINTLASAWDAIDQKFETKLISYRNRWLVERIAEKEGLKEQSAPAPC